MSRKKCKNIKLSLEELQDFSKDELIIRFLQIQDHNIQLKNILAKLQCASGPSSNEKKTKEYDFSKCETMHIFLKFLYLGWDYQGFAAVEDTLQTIEHKMFEALKKCCLIESRESAEYHRCGRTDKGVSAFNQVISLNVRKGRDGVELDYCGMLNRLLPLDIRVTGWCQVEPQSSARFNCTARTYRYYFPQAHLDIAAMKEAAQFLKGTHDFRNLCKMDVANGVVNFTREIIDADILQILPFDESGYGLCELRVIGSGFLWHQIRCIMAVLLMVGERLEKPGIISELLDIHLYPKKPQYTMANEVSLCLFYTKFNCPTPWIIDKTQQFTLVSQLQNLWTTNAIRTEQIRSMLRELESNLDTIPNHQAEILLGNKRPRKHQPLFNRNTCNSLEDRVEHYNKKFKTEDGSSETITSLGIESITSLCDESNS